jgi:hypothetical protein
MTVPRSAPVCVSPNFLGAIVQEQLPGTLGIGGKAHIAVHGIGEAPPSPALPATP